MADFDGERGCERVPVESVCAVSPSAVYFQGPLGRQELGPVTGTGGLQTIRQMACGTRKYEVNRKADTQVYNCSHSR